MKGKAINQHIKFAHTRGEKLFDRNDTRHQDERWGLDEEDIKRIIWN